LSVPVLHHVSIVATDLDRSVAFYQELFGLDRLHRPQLAVPGVWLARQDLQLHIILNPAGTFRPRAKIDIGDMHFALRTDDFDAVLKKLVGMGFTENAEPDDRKQMLVIRNSPAGFPQLYIVDPDLNIVEINGAKGS